MSSVELRGNIWSKPRYLSVEFAFWRLLLFRVITTGMSCLPGSMGSSAVDIIIVLKCTRMNEYEREILYALGDSFNAHKLFLLRSAFLFQVYFYYYFY